MNNENRDTIAESLVRYIKGAQRNVTILFADIENSTSLWDAHGDVKGRLIVDRHNRTLFPVIEKFRGKVVKTIGDAIMASFKKPEWAVRAAIAIQQSLKKEKRGELELKVRIGIHTGKAIVENDDVYGDVVNVASRIESAGAGGKIVLSEDTVNALAGRGGFTLSGKKDFTPRGKSEPLTVYVCDWRDHPDLTGGIGNDLSPILMIIGRQKMELLLYTAGSAALLITLYWAYFRFVLADLHGGLLSLSSAVRYPVIFCFAALLVLPAYYLLRRLAGRPLVVLSALKGGFHACAAFMVIFLPSVFFPSAVPVWLTKDILVFENTYLEVHEDDVSVRKLPVFTADVIRRAGKGDLLLLTDKVGAGKLDWHQVLIGPQEYGWVIKSVPAKMGVPEKRVSEPVVFIFCLTDLLALVLGMSGFIWGFLSLKIRPT